MRGSIFSIHPHAMGQPCADHHPHLLHAAGLVPNSFVHVSQLSQMVALECLVAPASAYMLLGQAGPALMIIIFFTAVGPCA